MCEVTHSLYVRGALHRVFTGLQPVRDSLLGETGLGVVMRHPFRLRFNHVGKRFFEQLCNLLVIMLPHASQ